MSWEKLKVGDKFLDKEGKLCKKYSDTEYDREPRISTEYFYKVGNEYGFGSYYIEPHEWVTVHYPKKGNPRVLFIYRTREAALLDALKLKNEGKKGHIAVLTIEVKNNGN